MMNHYFISRSENEPEKAFAVLLEFTVQKGISDLYFPFWRPGRYEPGNFVKYSRNFKVHGLEAPISVVKKAPNHWVINSEKDQMIQVSYEWCIHELNAGSSYLSESLFYVNPVNVFCFIKQSENNPIRVVIDVERNWFYAGGLRLKENEENNILFFEAENFDQLADSPFAFSKELNQFSFRTNEVLINVHSIGEMPKSWSAGDYSSLMKFTSFQIQTIKGFPVQEYHFIFLFIPHRMRHGVEHWNSTVIVMGQGDVSDEAYYDEVLSIASHELFHTWNVKYCRPKDLLPYDYTGPQYSATGFITEGVTTYYGELMLWRSGVWTWEKFSHCILDWLNVHHQNSGRFSSSLLDSSIDTWVDGYVKGTPGRKVSIYNEGALLAFITDVFVMKSSKGHFSLDDVMKALIKEFNVNGKGYVENDYWNIVQKLAGSDVTNLKTLVSNPVDYSYVVVDAMMALGQFVEKDDGLENKGFCISKTHPNEPQNLIEYKRCALH